MSDKQHNVYGKLALKVPKDGMNLKIKIRKSNFEHDTLLNFLTDRWTDSNHLILSVKVKQHF